MPRSAHCIGCGKTFGRMHLMIHHRRNNRCGGRFLPDDERELYSAAKKHLEAALKVKDALDIEDVREYNFHIQQHDAMLAKAKVLRAARLIKLVTSEAS